MVDFGSLAKKAQDALAQGSDKIEAALKDNAGKIEGAVDKAGQFAKDKMPDRAAQIDNATAKAKAAVPRHEDGGSATPDIPLATDTPTATPEPTHDTPPTHTTPDAGAPAWSPPGGAPTAPSATPEVDRAAEQSAPSSSGYAPPSPTPEVDRAARDQG